ncbi:MAG: 4Fe-4S binding protein [Candidatus Aenigmarchaeota archaeon]|nr:4Fe-4S binding protein [Candidatus Aenigmarchaeota archaeon]
MGWTIDREKCLKCGACVSVCPFLALELKDDGIKIDRNKCTLCGICEKVCPVGAIKVNKGGKSAR